MDSKLKSAKGTNTMRATSVTMTDKVKEQKTPPKGAEIISSTIRTETEEIMNGYLICKTYDITYKEEKDSSNNYCYYTEKWYSKEDPLTVTVTDKSLAEAFSAD